MKKRVVIFGGTSQKLKASDWIVYAVLVVLSLYTLFPLSFLFINSFKGQSDIVTSPLQLPALWDIAFLQNALGAINFFPALGVTAMITILSVTLQIIVSALVAWMMVRNKTKASFVLFMCFTAAMLIPFQSVMYPLLNIFEKLNLKNIPGLIIMYGGFGLSISVFLYHGFMKSVPRSIEEAALIDGANIFQIFFKVVMPLLKPTTATVIIMNGMWIWNDYLLPFLVIANEPVKTLTLQLYYAKLTSGQYGNPWELIFPAVLMTIIPIILIFLFLQKYIMKGVAAGAVKE
jgi:raffinose/stachyose/melibiose transport system permease protein